LSGTRLPNNGSLEEMKLYLAHLERLAGFDEDLIQACEQRAAARARLEQLKELLTSNVLGTA
jgi:hypothetical protein